MIYFSADIETDGLVAGISNMISLGCVAFDPDTGKILSRFKENLYPLPDLHPDQSTMNWWLSFPEAYKAATTNRRFAYDVMDDFVKWVGSFGQEQPILAVWKPMFDAAFIRYYLVRFAGKDLFGRAGSGLDIKTTAAIALNQSFSETKIADTPAKLGLNLPEHNHDALDDAEEQALVFVAARKKLQSRI